MRVLVVIAGVVGSVACGSAMPVGPSEVPSSPAPSSVAGSYTLYTIDGAPLPFILSRYGDTKIELLSDTLVLDPNGSATERATSRFSAGPRVQTSTTTDEGSFTIERG